ncbi:MAG: glycine betaine ABC transporter substrate-binding protein [Pseudomonadota bacterium]
MKNTVKSMGLAAAVSVLALPAFASEKVAIGVPSWTGAQAIAHVLGEVVTSRIGGEVEYVPGNNATIFQAMDQGKGDIDVHPDVWLPNQESFTNEYVVDKGTVTLSSNPYQGNQGFCVTKDFGEANDITDIADLSRPDIAELMDSDGNGLGEMWIGAPGWASANVNEVKTRDYGLLDFIEPIRAEEAVKTARIKDSIAKGEGYAFYCYEPHAVWFMFDVVMLTEPSFDPEKYVMVQPSDDPDWYDKSMVASKDALKDVQIAWSNSLVDRSPAIAEFFQNFKLDASDVSQLAFEISANGRDPAEVAAEWVNANSDRVDAMLGL